MSERVPVTFYPGRSIRVRLAHPGERFVVCMRCWGYGWEPKLTTMDGGYGCRDCGGEGQVRAA